MSAKKQPPVSDSVLEWMANDLETSARDSLQAWIILGQTNRYAENFGKAAVLRQAIGIKSIAERRAFLRANGISA